MHEDEFKSETYYPFDYCDGHFVIITNDLIRPLLNAAQINPFFWIDDVYLFGILPATVGSTKFLDIGENLTFSFDEGKQCFEQSGSKCRYVAMSHWVVDEPEKIWRSVISSLPRSVKNELSLFGLFE